MKLVNLYKQAAKVSKRSFLSVFFEALALRFSKNRLGLFEYIDFRLYMQDLSLQEKRSMLGARSQAMLIDILVDDYSRILSMDKVTMHIILSGYGFPVPGLKAVFRSDRPSVLPRIQSLEELKAFLDKKENIPVYVKRSFGSYGRGNVLISTYRDGIVTFGDGSSEGVAEFYDNLGDGRTLGWIFQEPLSSHPGIVAATGTAKVSGLRISTFMSPNGIKVAGALFKANPGSNDSDNYEHGSAGVLLCSVNVKTGTVDRVISGLGFDTVDNPPHPATGNSLVGFQVPMWQEAVSIVIEAQKAFPGFLCPGWDVAICPDGPRILEVNPFGDLDGLELVNRKTFLDEDFLKLLRERDLEKYLYSPAQRDKRSEKNGRTGYRKHHWPW